MTKDAVINYLLLAGFRFNAPAKNEGDLNITSWNIDKRGFLFITTEREDVIKTLQGIDNIRIQLICSTSHVPYEYGASLYKVDYMK